MKKDEEKEINDDTPETDGKKTVIKVIVITAVVLAVLIIVWNFVLPPLIEYVFDEVNGKICKFSPPEKSVLYLVI